MVSDFLLFLDEIKFETEIQKYPDLMSHDGVDYAEKTCTGRIVHGQDCYFNNDSVLN